MLDWNNNICHSRPMATFYISIFSPRIRIWGKELNMDIDIGNIFQLVPS